MPIRYAAKDRVLYVREVICHLSGKPESHRIAMMASGQRVMLDHVGGFATVKLLRMVAKPTVCCMDYCTGKNLAGARVEQVGVCAKIVGGAPHKRGVRVGTNPQYTRRLTQRMYSVLSDISLPHKGPFGRVSCQLDVRYWSAADRRYYGDTVHAPKWDRAPSGKNSGSPKVYYTVGMYLDITKRHKDILCKPVALQKQGRAYGLSRGCPTDDAGTAIISSDTPYYFPFTVESRTDTGSVTWGFLVDPNITAMPDRIKWVRVVLNRGSNIFIILEKNDL
mgnify:CR=1 FL=1